MSEIVLKRQSWFQLINSKLSWVVLFIFFALVSKDFYQRLWVSAEYSAKKVADQVPALQQAESPLALTELEKLWPLPQNAAAQNITETNQVPSHAVFTDKGGSYRLIAVFASPQHQGLWLARLSFTTASESSATGVTETQPKDLLVKPGDSVGRFSVETISINQLQLKADDKLISLYLFKPTSREEALK